MTDWREWDWQAWAAGIVEAVEAHGDGVTLVVNGERVEIRGRQATRQVRGNTTTSVIADGQGRVSVLVESGNTYTMVSTGAGRPSAVTPAAPAPTPARRRTRAPSPAVGPSATPPRRAPAQRAAPRRTTATAAASPFGPPQVADTGMCLVTGQACVNPARCMGSRCQRG